MVEGVGGNALGIGGEVQVDGGIGAGLLQDVFHEPSAQMLSSVFIVDDDILDAGFPSCGGMEDAEGGTAYNPLLRGVSGTFDKDIEVAVGISEDHSQILPGEGNPAGEL